MTNKKFTKKLFTLLMVLTFSMAMSAMAFAAETGYDMTGAITTSMGELSTQVFAIIAIVVPAILIILGAKMAITKGISVFRSLVAKA